MPKYRITNPETGESKVIEASKPPSQEDAWGHFQTKPQKVRRQLPFKEGMREATEEEAALYESPDRKMIDAALAVAGGLALVPTAAAALGPGAASVARVAMSPAGMGIGTAAAELARGRGIGRAAMSGAEAAIVGKGAGALFKRLGGMLRAAKPAPVPAGPTIPPRMSSTGSMPLEPMPVPDVPLSTVQVRAPAATVAPAAPAVPAGAPTAPASEMENLLQQSIAQAAAPANETVALSKAIYKATWNPSPAANEEVVNAARAAIQSWKASGWTKEKAIRVLQREDFGQSKSGAKRLVEALWGS